METIAATQSPNHVEKSSVTTQFCFACPRCSSPMTMRDDRTLICADSRHTFECIDGIWRLLPADRAAYFDQFVHEYETIRRHEGRNHQKSEYYEALPFEDLSGRYVADWHIRAVSFKALVSRVARPLEARLRRPLVVLDLGAGNGWLSNRLAQRGHHVAAIDLLINTADGLGACTHYRSRFTPMQAEFDRLPLASHQADLVIFNGSLHYSTNFKRTLTEALRVLRPEGQLVILDSPLYHDAESGRAMVREREEFFTREVGYPSNALPSENFLTYERLRELGTALGIGWQLHEPFYGLRWAARPLRARLRRHREPARFMLICGQAGPAVGSNHRTRRRTWRLILRAMRPIKALRQRKIVIENVAGMPLIVLPHVFNPHLLRSGEFFATQIVAGLVRPGETVLDLGTGSGICAVAAAQLSNHVVAVDINPEAVRCARINTLLNRVEPSVDVRQGDLFAPVAVERFDVVLFNPPFYLGTPNGLRDHAWRSNEVVARFAAELADHLTPNGRALVILSTDGEIDRFLTEFQEHHLSIEPVARRDLTNEIFTIYRLTVEEQGNHDHPL
ncbi:MAG TPA: methyltransferase domain-containing protein [Nitrolancea sp.]